MSVIKRKDGGWRIDIVIRRGKETIRVKRAAKGARNKAEAMVMERKLRGELELRANPGAKPPPFPEFADDFMEKYVRANNKHSEYESKAGILKLHLVPWFHEYRLDEIGDEALEGYKAAKLKLGLVAKTVNNHLAVMSKLLRKAVEWKRIAFAPRVQLLRVPQVEPDFLTFDDAEKLKKASAAIDPFGMMIWMGLNTGMRHGELIGLRWSDLHDGKLVVRQAMVRDKVTTPKSHKPREIPLNLGARAAIPLVRSNDKADAPVYSTSGGYLTRGECKWPLYSACKRAGIRRIGWHVLRHTFASHLAMRGVPLKTIQELLGHSDIRMTMRYAHLSPDVKVDAVLCLDQPGTTLALTEGQGPTTDRNVNKP